MSTSVCSIIEFAAITITIVLLGINPIQSLNEPTSNARSYGLCSLPETSTEPNPDSNSKNETREDDQLPCVCSEMVPRKMHFPPQTSPCPWKIYPLKTEIPQHYSQTITLGSGDKNSTFLNYVVTAKSVRDGHIVGHFEYQWDAIAVCCYEPGRNYSYEGKRLHPNLLVGSQSIRVQKPNQTVVWTAPRHFLGDIVFVATFWKSGKLYWPNVTSESVHVVKRNLAKDKETH